MRKPQAKRQKQPKTEPYATPESMVIGPFRYTIGVWRAEEAEAANALGFCDRVRNIIRLREAINDQTRAEVLLHEVLHALFYNSGLTHSEALTDREEMIVSQFGLGLISVMRANPDFMPFIARLLERDGRCC